MENAQVAERASARLEMRWEPMTDHRGRTHMEARWVTPGQATIARPAA